MATDGFVKLGRDFDKYMNRLSSGLRKGMKVIGDDVVDDITERMEQPKHGKFFGKRTRRSAPGESPAKQEGDLVRSLFNKKVDTKSSAKAKIIARAIGTPLKSGFELEVGRPAPKDGFGSVAPRPWLSPQLILLRVVQKWTKAIRPFTKRI